MTKGADFDWVEKQQAKRDDATPVKSSGRGQRKGDARRGRLLIDYKFTDSKSFSISVPAWEKHEKDAWNESYEPVVVPVFQMYRGRTLAIVDWDYLKGLEDELQVYYAAEVGQ